MRGEVKCTKINMTVVFYRVQSDFYYPRYLGILNFGLKNRRYTRSADKRGANKRSDCISYKLGVLSFGRKNRG